MTGVSTGPFCKWYDMADVDGRVLLDVLLLAASSRAP